jgi:hypothetical protein
MCCSNKYILTINIDCDENKRVITEVRGLKLGIHHVDLDSIRASLACVRFLSPTSPSDQSAG